MMADCMSYYVDIDSSQWVPATPETETEINADPNGGIQKL